MNDIILKLLNEFSVVSTPANPLIINKIFEQTPLEDGHHTSEYNEHYELLNRLKELAQDYFDFNGTLEAFNTRQRNFDALNQQKEEIITQIKALRMSIEQQSLKLMPVYKQLEDKANESLLARDPLALVHKHSKYEPMNSLVINRFMELDTACKEIELRKAKSRLVLLIDKFNILVTDLKNLDIACTHETSAKQVLEIKNEIDFEIDVLNNHYEQAKALQKAFAQRLSVEDLALKNEEFNDHDQELIKAQELNTTAINVIPLDERIKSRLNQEFNDSTDKNALLESYRRNVDSAWDYVNPFAWAAWSFNALTLNLDKHKHDLEQAELKFSIQYLELLTNRHHIQTRINENLANRTLLEKVMPHPGLNTDNNDGNEIGTAKLIKDTFKLFNGLHSFTSIIELQEDSSEADFYLTLLLNIPLISDKLEKRILTSLKLAELAPLYDDIERVRHQHELLIENDSLLPNIQEAAQETKTLEEQAPLIADYQAQLELCRTYQGDAKALDDLNTILAQNTLKLRQLHADLRMQANKAPKKAEIDSLHTHLSTITDTITPKINQLNQLTTLTLTKKIKEIEPLSYIISPSKSESSITDAETELNHGQRSIFTDISPVQSTEIETHPLPILVEASLIETLHQDKPNHSEEMTSTEDYSDDSGVDIPYQPGISINSPNSEPHPNQTISPEPTLEPPSGEEILTSSENFSSYVFDESSAEFDDAIVDDANHPAFILPGSVPSTLELVPDPSPQISDTSSEDVLANKLISPIFEQSSSTLSISPKQNCNLFASVVNPVVSTNPSSSDNSLSSCPSESTSSPLQEDEFTENQELKPIQNNLSNIKKWHAEIKHYILRQDEVIQQWYKAVYLALKRTLIEESTCYKAAHIIRDVLFELEHRKNSDVLRAYIRLCPNPDQDIDKLLSIKPSLLITENAVDASDLLIECPLQLKQYYLHYNKLKSSYPIEAELFLQAICSVHMVLLYAELPKHAITEAQMPSLAKDPRYEPLKRHRGFLQIWEMLEDLCRLIVGVITGQQEYEYAKRPCFFSTKSNRLIKEADNLIQELLPDNKI